MLPVIIPLVLTSVIPTSYSTNQPPVPYRSGRPSIDRPLIFGLPFGTGVYPSTPQPQNIVGGFGGGSLPIVQRVPLTFTYPTNTFTNFRPPPSPPPLSVNKQTISELVTFLNTQAQLNQLGGAPDYYDGFDAKSQTTANKVPKQTGKIVVYPLDKLRSIFPGVIRSTVAGQDGYLVSLPKEMMPNLKHNIFNMMNYYMSSANGGSGSIPNMMLFLPSPTQSQIQQNSLNPTTQQSQQSTPPPQPVSSGQKVQVKVPSVQHVATYAPSGYELYNDEEEYPLKLNVPEELTGYQLANSGNLEPYPEVGVPVAPQDVKSVGFQLIPSMFRLSKSISNESRHNTGEQNHANI